MAPRQSQERQSVKASAATSIRSLFTPRQQRHRSGHSRRSFNSKETMPTPESVREQLRPQPHSIAVEPTRQRTTPEQPEPPIVRVQLKPLDSRYKSLSFGIRHSITVPILERYMRDSYEEDGEPLAEAGVFQLYDSRGRPLSPEASITRETTGLWYRVSRSDGSGP